MGRRDAAELAPQVSALLAGSITLSVAHRTTATVLAARAAAMRLIGVADRIETSGPLNNGGPS